LTVLLAAGKFEEVVGTGFAITLFVLALLPLGLLFTSRWPDVGPVVSGAGDRHGLRSILAGITMLFVTALLGGASSQAPFLVIPLVIALVGLAGLAFVGLVAEARRTGMVLLGRPAEAAGAQAGAVTIGWLALAGTAIFPIVGPVVVLYLLARGAGAALLAAARRSPPDQG
jgi:hypothetical protein